MAGGSTFGNRLAANSASLFTHDVDSVKALLVKKLTKNSGIQEKALIFVEYSNLVQPLRLRDATSLLNQTHESEIEKATYLFEGCGITCQCPTLSSNEAEQCDEEIHDFQ